MIRVKSIELSNVKNVESGRIEFGGSDRSSRITGIYGQNGSGKTAVIDAFSCLMNLLRCEPLAPRCADLIGATSDSATVEVEFEIGPGSAESLGFSPTFGGDFANGKSYVAGYAFSFDSQDGSPRLVAESFFVQAASIMKRNLLSYDRRDESGGYSFLPDVRWGSLRSLAGFDASMNLAVAQRTDDLKASSKVFSNALVSFAVAAREGYRKKESSGSLSKAAKVAYEAYLKPLVDTVVLLRAFGERKLEVFDTTRGAALAFNAFSLSAPFSGCGQWLDASTGDTGKRSYLVDVTIDAEKSAVIPLDVYNSVISTVEVENRVLETIVPGLNIEIHLINKETMSDGRPGARVEVLSCRGGVRVPFRAESEGIKKIVSLLGRLIDVYNDDSACLVIDEIDSGIFEFLLGELLELMSERGKGQLIFTAHNLRPLECLPSRSLVFTTSNPKRRFIKFRGSAPSNNLRNQYLRAVNLGGQREQVYEPTSRVDMGSAFYLAGHPQDGNFEDLLSQLAVDHG